jgi:carbon-monoxide dehydrogenase medium subunit
MVDADDFFTSTWTTAVEADELLVAVHFPVWPGTTGFAVEEVARRHGDFALAGAAAAIRIDGGKVAQAGLGLFGVGSTPVRATAVESGLSGASADLSDDDLTDLARAQADALDPPEDVHASSRYRKRVIVGLISSAVRSAIQEASRG